MKFIVVELQTANGTTGNLVYSYDTRAEAESKYYAVLSAAAVSSVAKHAAILMTEEGFPLMHACYTHEA